MIDGDRGGDDSVVVVVVFLCFRITATLSCPMKLHKYPLDTQGCPMLLRSCKFAFSLTLLHYLVLFDGRYHCAVVSSPLLFTMLLFSSHKDVRYDSAVVG